MEHDEAALVRTGVEAFERSAYFEAHERFEDAWRASTPRSLELHALTQVAAAMHKHEVHGKPDAARAIMLRARRKMDGSGVYVDLVSLRADADAWLVRTDAAPPSIHLRTRR